MFGKRQPKTLPPQRNTLDARDQQRFNELQDKGTEGQGLDSREAAEFRELGLRAGLRFDR